MHNLAYQAENRIKVFPLVCKRKTYMLGPQQSMKCEVKKKLVTHRAIDTKRISALMQNCSLKITTGQNDFAL